MKKTVIIVGSITYAMKLRKLFAREKITSRLIKLDNTEDNLGCTHAVEINSDDFYSAVVIMRKNNIEYRIQ